MITANYNYLEGVTLETGWQLMKLSFCAANYHLNVIFLAVGDHNYL